MAQLLQDLQADGLHLLRSELRRANFDFPRLFVGDFTVDFADFRARDTSQSRDWEDFTIAVSQRIIHALRAWVGIHREVGEGKVLLKHHGEHTVDEKRGDWADFEETPDFAE